MDRKTCAKSPSTNAKLCPERGSLLDPLQKDAFGGLRTDGSPMCTAGEAPVAQKRTAPITGPKAGIVN